MVIHWVTTPALQTGKTDAESLLMLGSNKALGTFVFVYGSIDKGLGNKSVPVLADFKLHVSFWLNYN